MIAIERIEDWRGQAVVDRHGENLGKLDEVFYAPGTTEPVLIAVRSGLLGRKSSLIPLHGASAGRDRIQVAHDQATIDATADIHRGETPTVDELTALGEAYGIRLTAGDPLQSATERDAQRAEGEAARRRAEEAAAEEQARRAESAEAGERARQAAEQAQAAERSAQEAGATAARAQAEAERHQQP
ncbi:MAG TPA: PRC-barrel domain-containing protein [Solirubrobacteraceae bacterium]|nr:PRC-barrel domain-containing protein [Solirubrobacteraceae bacterium]